MLKLFCILRKFTVGLRLKFVIQKLVVSCGPSEKQSTLKFPHTINSVPELKK
jgi:hypothetical protein